MRGELTESQVIPRNGSDREILREKGQFWTPDWVAGPMARYVLGNGSNHIFDPAVGTGAFFRAAKRVFLEAGRTPHLRGIEIDREVLDLARCNGLSHDDLSGVTIDDFILRPPQGPFQAIVANPPYIRHHRLTRRTKDELKKISANIMGTTLDGRAGLHVYFLIRALHLLGDKGRLAFIMPADTCEGVFSSTVWNWVTQNYRLDAVITFAPTATPFPRVDTNPIIFMIANEAPNTHFPWVKCIRPQPEALKDWVVSGLGQAECGDMEISRRNVAEALSTGLSRKPATGSIGGVTLRDFAEVRRGIATGANDFFFLTSTRAGELGIPDDLLVPAVARTRDVPGNKITLETLRNLDAKGRPTLLFSPDGRAIDDFPTSVREYLLKGEALGIHRKSLVATRRPWYKMETRTPPPILFAYLGRRNVRFVRNLAEVAPLTGFLCVYPHQDNREYVDHLWSVLQQPETVSNLSLVGKSYGAGAIKVEPRALEKLPLPPEIGLEVGLDSPPNSEQAKFW